MIKESITYTDFEGDECTEVFYFNISRPELIDLQFSVSGGLRNHISRMMETNDTKELYELLKEVIVKSYGVKSPDGKSFVKKDANGRYLGELFLFHAAYEVFIEKLITEEDAMASFINGVVPELTAEERKQSEKIQKELAEQTVIDFKAAVEAAAK